MTVARARRVRRWSAVCALFLLALTVACQNNSFRMADSGGRFIALRGSTLQVGWSAQAPAGWTVDHNGWPFGLNAWRPYRTVGKNWDYLVIPLWLPLSIAVCSLHTRTAGYRMAAPDRGCVGIAVTCSLVWRRKRGACAARSAAGNSVSPRSHELCGRAARAEDLARTAQAIH